MKRINTKTFAGIALAGCLGSGTIVQAASLSQPYIKITQQLLQDKSSKAEMDLSGLGEKILSLELSITCSNIKDQVSISTTLPDCYMTYTQNVLADGRREMTCYIISNDKKTPLAIKGESSISFNLQQDERMNIEECRLKTIALDYEVSVSPDVRADLVLIGPDGSQLPAAPEENKPVEKPSEPEENKPIEKPSEPEENKPVEKPSEPEENKPVEKPSEPEENKPVEKPSEPEENKPVEKPSEPEGNKPVEKPSKPEEDKPAERPSTSDDEDDDDEPVKAPSKPPSGKPASGSSMDSSQGGSSLAASENTSSQGSGEVNSHGSQAVPFTDAASHWARASIVEMSRIGVIRGYADGSFRPNATITRGEFAAILVRAFELKTKDNSTMNFKDVAAGKWYTEAIQALYDSGITSGRLDGTFGVSDAITNEELSALLYRTISTLKIEVPLEKENAGIFKDDEKIASYAKEAVASLNKLGIVNGRPDGTFAPKASTTRAQVAVMIDRLLQKVK